MKTYATSSASNLLPSFLPSLNLLIPSPPIVSLPSVFFLFFFLLYFPTSFFFFFAWIYICLPSTSIPRLVFYFFFKLTHSVSRSLQFSSPFIFIIPAFFFLHFLSLHRFPQCGIFPCLLYLPLFTLPASLFIYPLRFYFIFPYVSFPLILQLFPLSYYLSFLSLSLFPPTHTPLTFTHILSLHYFSCCLLPLLISPYVRFLLPLKSSS